MSTELQHYFSNANREQIGPISRAELQDALLAPTWYAKAMIWREGWARWLPWPEAARQLGLTLPTPAITIPPLPSEPPLPAIPLHDQQRPLPSDNLYAPPMASVHAVDARTGAEMEYASFWIRFAAYIVDRFILLIAMVIVIAVLSVALAATGAEKPDGEPDALGMSLMFAGILFAIVLMPAAYFIYFEQSQSGATPGKRLFGIRVADLDGQRISLGAAFMRNLIAAISSTFYSVGHLVAAFTERHQALHDFAASTVVIHAYAAPSPNAGTAHQGQRQRRRLGGAAVFVIILAIGIVPMLAIMAAIALPAYQDYTLRAKVASVYAETAELRSKVQDFRDRSDDQCPVNGDANFNANEEYRGQYYAGIEFAPGENSSGDRYCMILVTLANTQHSELEGKVLKLVLSPERQWSCLGDGLPERYLPGVCRMQAASP